MIRIVIERRISDRAHQHRGRRKASLQGIGRQRILCNGERRAANVLVLELKLVAECVGNGLQNKNGLLGDFGADSVTGEDGEVQKHAGISLIESAFMLQVLRRCMSRAALGGHPGARPALVEGAAVPHKS